jgi:hypothetical protein
MTKGMAALPERAVAEEKRFFITSGGLGADKVMNNGLCSATTVPGSAALAFVISTGAQRSGEICGFSPQPW